MATAGLDRKLQLWDLRTYQALRGLLLPLGAAELAFSQRGLLAAACGDLVQVGHGRDRPNLGFYPPPTPNARPLPRFTRRPAAS